MKHKEHKNKNSPSEIIKFFKFLFAFALLVGSVLVVYFDELDSKFHLTAKTKEAYVMPVKIMTGDNTPKSSANQVEVAKAPQPVQPAQEDIFDPVEQPKRNAYPTLIEVKSDKSNLQDVIESNLAIHQNIMINISILFARFSISENYTRELEVLKKHSAILNSEMKANLAAIEDYNKSFLCEGCVPSEYNTIELENTNIFRKALNKLFYIEKKNLDFHAYQAQYKKIKSYIYELRDYYSSPEILRKYLNND